MRYGVLDLGGEGLTLAVVEQAPNGEFHTLRRDTLALRLEPSKDRQDPPPGMVDLAVETLRRLVAVAERSGCQDVSAVLRPTLARSSTGTTLAAHLNGLVHGPVALLTEEDEVALTRAVVSATNSTPPPDLAVAIVLRALEGVSAADTRAAGPRTAASGARAHPQPS